MPLAVRYIVNDATEAAAFYRDHLRFEVVANPGPGFAMLRKEGTQLLLNAPGAGGAGRAGSDAPAPGGWCRFQILVDDLDGEVSRLRAAHCTIRGDIVDGNAGRQALVEDPSGNPIELFEPATSPELPISS